MKKKLPILFLLALLTNLCTAQDHVITLQGLAFSPNNLTVTSGETVLFDNVGGAHNVNGSLTTYPDNPEGFESGAVAAAPWQFTHTFTTPGVYDYQCDPHVSFDMVGVITVEAAMAGEIIITEINYNNPGSDSYEFIEVYNNGDEAVDMQGWAIANIVDFTFPAFVLGVGEYAIIAGDAAEFETAFGFLPLGEYSGSLTNTMATIELLDGSGALVDMVNYADSAPWPTEADGDGPSLVLCDYNTDNNDGANWAAATTPTGFEVNGVGILANPGADSQCPTGPIVGLLNDGFTVLEDAGSVSAILVMGNGDAGTTTVDLVMDMASTATNGEDFSLSLPFTVTFDVGVANDTQIVTINLIDDMDIEVTEELILNVTNPTNGASISPNASEYILGILDNDTPLTNAMVITGVFDTEPGGAGAKGVELQALEDISDISIFGVGSANNGTGSAGVETMLPVMSVSAGECIYVTDDAADFLDFFGFEPTVEGSAANINGNDAIELFENNIPIDIYGETTVDGSGEPWDYLDGWAYRKSGTGPDGTIFEVDNWDYSGPGAIAGAANNNEADPPFPTCSYSPVAPTTAIANDDNAVVPFNTAQIINVLGNDQTPNPLTSMTVTIGPANGSATVNGLNDITYEPDSDYCGPDAFTYEICDAAGCDEATVNITVECPTTYTPYTIAEVTEVDAEGTPVLIDEPVEVTGVVYGIDLQGVNAMGDPLDAIQFTLIDDTGGVAVFNGQSLGYTVQEGDEITIQGTVSEFNCLTQINELASLTVNSSGNTLVDPEITAFLNEDFESELIEVTNLEFVNPSQWAGDGSSFNVQVKKTFANDTLLMRIDNDNELSSMPIPSSPFNARGIGGQFSGGNCLVGYQFLPRYAADIIPLNNAEENLLAQKITYFPNPVSSTLTIQVDDLKLEKITVANLVGQRLIEVESPGNSLDVSALGQGVYLVTFYVEGAVWTGKFVKN